MKEYHYNTDMSRRLGDLISLGGAFSTFAQFIHYLHWPAFYFVFNLIFVLFSFVYLQFDLLYNFVLFYALCLFFWFFIFFFYLSFVALFFLSIVSIINAFFILLLSLPQSRGSQQFQNMTNTDKMICIVRGVRFANVAVHLCHVCGFV